MRKLQLTDEALKGAIRDRVHAQITFDFDNPYYRDNITDNIFEGIRKTKSYKWLGGKQIEVIEDDVLRMIFIGIDCERMNVEFKGKLQDFLRTAKVCEQLGMSENPEYFEYIEKLNCRNKLQVAFALGAMKDI